MYIRFILLSALTVSLANAETIGNTSGEAADFIPPLSRVQLVKDPSCHMPPIESSDGGDQPGACRVEGGEPVQGENFEKTVRGWDSIQDMNDWIGRYFHYDRERMAKFGENVPVSQKGNVYTPDQLLDFRTGVCFDLSRFAYEAVSKMPMNPKVENLKYTKIKFDPIEIDGATIRMHWMISYKIDGQYYFTGDSRCPGRVYGPYPTPEKFGECYSAFRGRPLDSIDLVDTYKKRPGGRSLKTQRRSGG